MAARLRAARAPAPTTMTTTMPFDTEDLPQRPAARSACATDGDGIDYRERSPLVVPPSRDLPPPEPRRRRRKTADLAERSRRQARQASARPSASRRNRDRKTTAVRCCRASAAAGRAVARQPARPARPRPIERRAPADDALPSSATKAASSASLFGARQGRVRDVHRRAAARSLDRAAARLSHAVAQPALRRRQGEVDTSVNQADRARRVEVTQRSRCGRCPDLSRQSADRRRMSSPPT